MKRQEDSSPTIKQIKKENENSLIADYEKEMFEFVEEDHPVLNNKNDEVKLESKSHRKLIKRTPTRKDKPIKEETQNIFYQDEEEKFDSDGFIGRNQTQKHCDSSSDQQDQQPQKADSKIHQKPQNHRLKTNKKRRRKIRTTITKDKLIEMNRIFNKYATDKEENKTPEHNLKEIGIKLQLGYSTILHKFRQFRATKKVKGGALIASLQKKRKYKKSLYIEQIIEEALSNRAFYTAVELSKYIFQSYHLNFSRSIISRHLGEMGYSYKNLKNTPIEKNKPKYKDVRRLYSEIMLPLIEDGGINFLYLDELACSLTNFLKKKGGSLEVKKIESIKVQDQYISIMVICTNEGILFHHICEGYFTRRRFLEIFQEFFTNLKKTDKARDLQGSDSEYYLVMDLHKIHRDDENKEPGIQNFMIENNIEIFFLPPSSPQLNPVESIFTNLKNRLSKKDIKTLEDLENEIKNEMKQIESEPTEVYFKDLKEWLEKSKIQQNF